MKWASVAGVLLIPIWIVTNTAVGDDPVIPEVNPQCEDKLALDTCWTTEDVLQSPIDHHAQSALLFMFARGGQQAADASAILCATKRGDLQGIFLPNQQIPALRIRKLGGNWWEMIPKNDKSICFAPADGEPPLIAFGKQIKDQVDIVAKAVSKAWNECKIPATLPRCYTTTIVKPPKGDSLVEGHGRLEVFLVDPEGGLVPDEMRVILSPADIDDFELESQITVGRGNGVGFTALPGEYDVTAQRIITGKSCPFSAVEPASVDEGVTTQIEVQVPRCF